MRVEGQLNPAALWFKNVEKDPSSALDALVDAAANGKSGPAKAAATNTSFPTQTLAKLDSASILSLQQIEFTVDENGKPDGISATDEFMAYMEKTPEERLRDDILKSLGLTEEDLENLPPEQRQAIEDKIKEMIKEKIRPVEDLGLQVSETVKKRPGWAQMIEMGLVTPGTDPSAMASIGLPDDVLAAAGYKPPQKQ
jgi:hypothetical protein